VSPTLGTLGGGSSRAFGMNRETFSFASIVPDIGGAGVLSSSANFNVSGEWTLTPNLDFSATVKLWGAGGACGYKYQETITSTTQEGPGGGGGYASATVAFKSGSVYKIQVGEGGIRITTGSGTGATYVAGGVPSTTVTGGAEGGGYSGLFITSATFANVYLMAGGGGGGADTAFSANGGGGGGTTGEPGQIDDLQAGKGGTASAGGVASAYNGATAGSALTGGVAQIDTADGAMGGGGGGYYGGGGGNVGGGGGGSGRVTSHADITSTTLTQASADTPANSADGDRNGAGQGGDGTPTAGTDGLVLITVV
jgi:hypothetical protein